MTTVWVNLTLIILVSLKLRLNRKSDILVTQREGKPKVVKITMDFQDNSGVICVVVIKNDCKKFNALRKGRKKFVV